MEFPIVKIYLSSPTEFPLILEKKNAEAVRYYVVENYHGEIRIYLKDKVVVQSEFTSRSIIKRTFRDPYLFVDTDGHPICEFYNKGLLINDNRYCLIDSHNVWEENPYFDIQHIHYRKKEDELLITAKFEAEPAWLVSVAAMVALIHGKFHW